MVSYQTSNHDLHATFASARAHLKPGGLFLFDCWYGPAVLMDRPVVRVKRMEDEVIRVLRIAEPQMHPNENRVDVQYTLLILDKQTGQLTETQETHHMRYLFRPEIEYFLKTVNIDLIACEEWLSGRNPGFDTWSVCFLASNQFGGLSAYHLSV